MDIVSGDSLRAEAVRGQFPVDPMRTILIPIPRDVFLSPDHTLIRFGQVNVFDDRTEHWNNLILYSFVMNLVKDTVQNVDEVYYTTSPLDGSSSKYVLFIVKYKGIDVSTVVKRCGRPKTDSRICSVLTRSPQWRGVYVRNE
jgi:hypothetical protein